MSVGGTGNSSYSVTSVLVLFAGVAIGEIIRRLYERESSKIARVANVVKKDLIHSTCSRSTSSYASSIGSFPREGKRKSINVSGFVRNDLVSTSVKSMKDLFKRSSGLYYTSQLC